MIRILILAFTLAYGLPSRAGTDKHFLNSFGNFTLRDSTNQVSVTASQSGDKSGSILILWAGYDSTGSDLPPGDYKISDAVPLIENGWFVFAEDSTHIWVFDGGTLRFMHFVGKTLTDTASPTADKSWPKQVRDALPESYRNKWTM